MGSVKSAYMLQCATEVLYRDVGHRAGETVREIAEGVQPEVHLVSRVEVRDDEAVAAGDDAVRVRRRLGEHCGVVGVVYLQAEPCGCRAEHLQLDAIGSALDDFEPVGVVVGVPYPREVASPSVGSSHVAAKQHVQRAVPCSSTNCSCNRRCRSSSVPFRRTARSYAPSC